MLGTIRVCGRQVLLGIVLLFVVGFSTYGQSQISASLSGSVVDPSGQPVNNAKIVLASQGKGLSRTFTTSENGLYTFTLLPQDTYNLDIEAPGFKHRHQEGISLVAGQAATLNVSLVLGAVTEHIEVTSQAPLLNAENANISADISSRQVSELPLNFRNVIGLATLNSSVSNAAEAQVVGSPGQSAQADQDVSFLNFGGTFFNTPEYLIYGTWHTPLD